MRSRAPELCLTPLLCAATARPQPAVGTKRKAEDAPDDTPELATGDGAEGVAGAPDEAPPPKVSVQLDVPLVLGPKTFTHTGDVYKYFGALLSTWTMHQTFNEVRLPSRPCHSRHPCSVPSRRLCAPPDACWPAPGAV
jgi:hypothetical protein